MLFAHWDYAYRKKLLTDTPEVQIAVNKALRNRIIVAQRLYAFGAALCFVSVYLSIFVILAVQFRIVKTKLKDRINQ